MPSPEGCMTCLAVLEEMIPLLGPLAPTMSKVYEALRLCLLSRAPRTGHPSTHKHAHASTHTQGRTHSCFASPFLCLA